MSYKVGSTDLSSLMSQIQGLSSFAGSSGAGVGSYSVADVNSIFSLLGNCNNLTSCDASNIPNTLSSIVNQVISFASCRVSSEASKKSSEAQSTSQKVDNNLQQAEEKNNSQTQAAEAKVEENQKQAEETKEKTDKVQQEKEKVREEREKTKDNIDETQQQAVQASNPKQQREKVQKIQELGGELEVLGEQSLALDDVVADLSSEQEESKQKLEQSVTDKEQVETDNIERIAAVASQAQTQVQQQQEATVQAPIHEAAADTLELEATAVQNAPFGTGTGAATELRRRAADFRSASNTEQQTALFVGASLVKAAEKFSYNAGQIQAFSNSVGSAICNHSNLVGDIQSRLPELLTGVGSGETDKQVAQNLSSAASNDSQKLAQGSDLANSGNPVTETGSNAEAGNSAGTEENGSNLESAKVDTKPLEQEK